MWRTSKEEWERRKSYLIRSLFEDLPILSPIYESQEPTKSSSDNDIDRLESPLPDLIIEKELPKAQKYHLDEPEEFYDKLQRDMRRLYKRDFLNVQEDSSTVSDMTYEMRNETNTQLDSSIDKDRSLEAEELDEFEYYSGMSKKEETQKTMSTRSDNDNTEELDKVGDNDEVEYYSEISKEEETQKTKSTNSDNDNTDSEVIILYEQITAEAQVHTNYEEVTNQPLPEMIHASEDGINPSDGSKIIPISFSSEENEHDIIEKDSETLQDDGIRLTQQESVANPIEANQKIISLKSPHEYQLTPETIRRRQTSLPNDSLLFPDILICESPKSSSNENLQMEIERTFSMEKIVASGAENMEVDDSISDSNIVSTKTSTPKSSKRRRSKIINKNKSRLVPYSSSSRGSSTQELNVLSPIYESQEPSKSSSDNDIDRLESPLPDLIIEKELPKAQKYHLDEPEEFYDKLQRDMRRLYKRDFLNVQEDSSTVSDMTYEMRNETNTQLDSSIDKDRSLEAEELDEFEYYSGMSKKEETQKTMSTSSDNDKTEELDKVGDNDEVEYYSEISKEEETQKTKSTNSDNDNTDSEVIILYEQITAEAQVHTNYEEVTNQPLPEMIHASEDGINPSDGSKIIPISFSSEENEHDIIEKDSETLQDDGIRLTQQKSVANPIEANQKIISLKSPHEYQLTPETIRRRQTSLPNDSLLFPDILICESPKSSSNENLQMEIERTFSMEKIVASGAENMEVDDSISDSNIVSTKTSTPKSSKRRRSKIINKNKSRLVPYSSSSRGSSTQELNVLSPTYESQEPSKSSSNNDIDRLESPLPDLIIEKELPKAQKYHLDEPEEFYDKLQRDMRRLYKRDFLNVQEDSSTVSDMTYEMRNETNTQLDSSIDKDRSLEAEELDEFEYYSGMSKKEETQKTMSTSSDNDKTEELDKVGDNDEVEYYSEISKEEETQKTKSTNSDNDNTDSEVIILYEQITAQAQVHTNYEEVTNQPLPEMIHASEDGINPSDGSKIIPISFSSEENEHDIIEKDSETLQDDGIRLTQQKSVANPIEANQKIISLKSPHEYQLTPETIRRRQTSLPNDSLLFPEILICESPKSSSNENLQMEIERTFSMEKIVASGAENMEVDDSISDSNIVSTKTSTTKSAKRRRSKIINKNKSRLVPYSSSSRGSSTQELNSKHCIALQTSFCDDEPDDDDLKDIWKKIFVGTPTIYNICSCRNHVCS